MNSSAYQDSEHFPNGSVKDMSNATQTKMYDTLPHLPGHDRRHPPVYGELLHQHDRGRLLVAVCFFAFVHHGQSLAISWGL